MTTCGRLRAALRHRARRVLPRRQAGSVLASGAGLPFLVLLSLVLLVGASPAGAQSIDKPTALLEAGANALALLELSATEACVQGGTCREANPWMPEGATRRATAGRVLLKASTHAAATWLTLKLSAHPDRKWKWAARGVAVGQVVLNGYLAKRALDRHPRP